MTPVVSPRHLTIAAIRAATAEHFGLTDAAMVSRAQKRKFSEPRMIAMYIARRVAKRELSIVGKYMGSRHHTTVLHAERSIHARLHDPKVMAHLTAICAKLGERA